MVGHPPPPRDHPDEDVWQRMLRVFAQSAETVQEALGPAIFLTDSGSSYPRPDVKCKDKRLRHLYILNLQVRAWPPMDSSSCWLWASFSLSSLVLPVILRPVISVWFLIFSIQHSIFSIQYLVRLWPVFGVEQRVRKELQPALELECVYGLDFTFVGVLTQGQSTCRVSKHSRIFCSAPSDSASRRECTLAYRSVRLNRRNEIKIKFVFHFLFIFKEGVQIATETTHI